MKQILKRVLKRSLGEKRYSKLVTYKNRGVIIPLKYGFGKADKLTLQEIGKYHQTDKYIHSFAGFSYLDIYARYLSQLRDKELSVLEIGVKDGASLRMWRSYFSNARIYGVD